MPSEHKPFHPSLHLEETVAPEGETRIALEGEISHDTVEGLMAKLMEIYEPTGADRLILDLERVSMIDSQGIGLVCDLNQRLGERKIEIILEHPSDWVRRVLHLMHIDRMIKVR